MTAPRIFYALAEDGLFPRAIARVDPRTSSPVGAVVLCTVLGVIFILIRTFQDLADQFIIGIWPFYALAVASVFVLRRRRPDLERPYRTWGYPIVPLLFLLGAVFLLGNYLVSQPGAFAWRQDLGTYTAIHQFRPRGGFLYGFTGSLEGSSDMAASSDSVI